jgi:hypothetical protein
MAQPTAMLDFFVLEASDYLERLDAVVQTRAGTPPSGEEFVRLARAFRGSALMANQQVMARAAQGLEAAARGVRDGRLAWDERVRSELVRAVDDCKILLRRVKAPEAGDSQRAEAIGLGLERLAGRPSAIARAHTDGLDAGGRAFVGREAASIASALDRVARTLGMDPGARDVLNGIGPVMSQLRGVAILNDLPPLAEVLAAVDGAVKLVHATKGPVPADVAGVFDTAAKSLARAAREVVETGRPASSSEEARAFTAALLRTFLRLGDPVPVELLAPADGASIVTAGQAPAEGAAPPRVELVSQGEFLAAAATELGRATSEVQRDLRLFAIGASLKPLMDGDGSSLARALAAFAEAGWWAIGTGAAASEPDRFVEVMSDAASTLRSADTGDEPRIGQLLLAHASRLLLRLPYPPPKEPLVGAPLRPAAPKAAPAPVAPPVAPAAPPRPAPPAPLRTTAVRPLPAMVPAEGGGLAASWSTLEALIGERGTAPGSFDEFLAGTGARASAPAAARAVAAAAPPERPIVPIESLAPDDAGVVPIESLLYDGDTARRRLREVQGELDAALATAGTSPQVRALLGEVFDLIDLGLHPAR